MGFIHFDMTKPMDVIPVGRLAIDFNPIDTMRTLDESTTFRKYVGGSPANIAVGLARLGNKVGFIGKVSNDQFGRFVLNYFMNEGIDTSGITLAQNGESLGLTFTEIKSPSDCDVLMYRNGVADLAVSPADVSEHYVKNAKMVVISGGALSASPSREAAFFIMEYARKHGTVVAFDVDFRNYSWKSKEEIAIYYSFAGRMSDIIIGSREEFSLMEYIIDPLNLNDRKTADRLLENGSSLIIIKHGKSGSTAYAKDGNAYKVGTFPVNLVKTFGGGDAYASALLHGAMADWPIEEVLEFATASASILVGSHSCSDAMPNEETIREFVKTHREMAGPVITKI